MQRRSRARNARRPSSCLLSRASVPDRNFQSAFSALRATSGQTRGAAKVIGKDRPSRVAPSHHNDSREPMKKLLITGAALGLATVAAHAQSADDLKRAL